MTDQQVEHPREGYIERLPGGLVRALSGGRWLPIIGAGISATATTPDHRSPPGWSLLGNQLASDLTSKTVTSPVDAISAYSDTYGRASLLERLSDLLLVESIEPGDVHGAFAQLPFDTVVTTNIDFLLEQAYERQRRPCVPLIGESQLSIQRRPEATYLLKFHGDLRHPDNLVMTEEDYDGFVRRNPLLATYLSWWLLTKEPVFFGYSLDDADLRELLGLLRERLGRMTRPAWAILATDKHHEARKFERRGVRPVVLSSDPDADRSQVLATFFRELREKWNHGVVHQIETHTDTATAELRRAKDIAPQLALFIASDPVLSLYRENVFPAILDTGFMPIGIDEIWTYDRSTKPMAIDIALSKAAVAIYDASRHTSIPREYVVSRRNGRPVIVIHDAEETSRGMNLGEEALMRPASQDMDFWQEELVTPLADRLVTLNREFMDKVRVAPNLEDLRRKAQPISVKENCEKELSIEEKEMSRPHYIELLLACLALLDSELRSSRTEPGTAAPLPEGTSVSRGQMSRLREHYGQDSEVISQAMRLRHDLMQNLEMPYEVIVAAAESLYSVVRQRLLLRPEQA
jgi:hypothetical protein